MYYKMDVTGSYFKKLKLPKLNEFPDIYDIQIFTMICINNRSVNAVWEQKGSANKNVLVCIY